MPNPVEEAIVRCETTAGSFAMKFYREWAPNGYDRAIELFERKFYDESYFFRVVPKFLVQFGISYSKDKELQKFSRTPIQDDPSKGLKFNRGTISFAGSGPNSRTSHLFISYGSSPSLGTQLWETALGEIIEGMENVENLYSYGDMPPWGKGPNQGKVHKEGYIEENFPKTDKFLHCKVERLNDDMGGKLEDVTRKGDHTTDEEEFAKARDMIAKGSEDGKQQTKSNLKRRDLRPVENDVLKMHQEQFALPIPGNEKLISIGMMFVLVAVGTVVMILRQKKKVDSKSN